MLVSTSLVIIYIAVNASHLRLLKETEAKRWMIQISLLSSLVFLGVLVYFEFTSSKLVWELLTITLFFASLLNEYIESL